MKKKITINKVKSFGTCAKIVAVFFALLLICNVSTAQPWLQVTFCNNSGQSITIDWPGYTLVLKSGNNHQTEWVCDDIEYDVYYKDASGNSKKIFWVTYKRGKSAYGDIDFYCDASWVSAIQVWDGSHEKQYKWQEHSDGSGYMYFNDLFPGDYPFIADIINTPQP